MWPTQANLFFSWFCIFGLLSRPTFFSISTTSTFIISFSFSRQAASGKRKNAFFVPISGPCGTTTAMIRAALARPRWLWARAPSRSRVRTEAATRRRLREWDRVWSNCSYIKKIALWVALLYADLRVRQAKHKSRSLPIQASKVCFGLTFDIWQCGAGAGAATLEIKEDSRQKCKDEVSPKSSRIRTLTGPFSNLSEWTVVRANFQSLDLENHVTCLFLFSLANNQRTTSYFFVACSKWSPSWPDLCCCENSNRFQVSWQFC